ncbi:MAG: flagellar basal body rod protein FlgC [Verrucomicrobiota bacterium]
MNLALLPGIQNTTAALDAERVRLDVVAQNIANANTTRGPDGQPYQRQQVVFENVLRQAQGGGTPQLRVARIESDARPPRLVFNPSHPDADPQGMVALPDIDVHEEMADLITASRAFEANLAVLRNARHMALQTLSLGKR